MSIPQRLGTYLRRHLSWPPDRGRRGPLTTREIAIVAVLASLGGVMSAYVGYLGWALNKLAGVPFGAGQFLAGLHVFWMVLAVALTGRVGVGTSTGLLKGTVELLAGSSKGVLVIALSLLAGLVVDLVWALAPRRGAVATVLAGGLGTASNVVLFLLFTGTYHGLAWLFLVLLAVSFVSGTLFAGLLVANVTSTLSHAGFRTATPELVRPGGGSRGRRGHWSRPTWASVAVTVVALSLLFGGALAYHISLGDGLEDMREGLVSVEGAVGEPYAFELEDFAGEEVTVRAELVGDYTHEPPRNYTGVTLATILQRAQVTEGASEVHVVGVDGYGVNLMFDLEEVMDPATEEGFLLVEDHGQLKWGGTGDYYRLVCKDLEGGWWVRWVVRITVE